MRGRAAALTRSNPELEQRSAEMQIQRAKEAADNSSFASYLLGKLCDETFEVEIMDGATIVLREPNDADFMDLMDAQLHGLGVAQKAVMVQKQYPDDDLDTLEFTRVNELQAIIKDGKMAMHAINSILATLSVDPSLDAEFYRKLPSKYKYQIISEIQARRSGQVEKAKKFRKK